MIVTMKSISEVENVKVGGESGFVRATMPQAIYSERVDTVDADGSRRRCNYGINCYYALMRVVILFCFPA